jgi:hypothetical protein
MAPSTSDDEAVVRSIVDGLTAAAVLDAAVFELARETVTSYIRKRSHAVAASAVLRPLPIHVDGGQNDARPAAGHVRRGLATRVLRVMDRFANCRCILSHCV